MSRQSRDHSARAPKSVSNFGTSELIFGQNVLI